MAHRHPHRARRIPPALSIVQTLYLLCQNFIYRFVKRQLQNQTPRKRVSSTRAPLRRAREPTRSASVSKHGSLILGYSWFSGLSAYGLSPVVGACPRTCLPTYTWPAALPGSPTTWAHRAGCRAELHEGGAELFKAARGEEGSARPRDTTAHNARVPPPNP